jgi:hypothetical protein
VSNNDHGKLGKRFKLLGEFLFTVEAFLRKKGLEVPVGASLTDLTETEDQKSK